VAELPSGSEGSFFRRLYNAKNNNAAKRMYPVEYDDGMRRFSSARTHSHTSATTTMVAPPFRTRRIANRVMNDELIQYVLSADELRCSQINFYGNTLIFHLRLSEFICGQEID
jgi:hypothetical protein